MTIRRRARSARWGATHRRDEPGTRARRRHRDTARAPRWRTPCAAALGLALRTSLVSAVPLPVRSAESRVVPAALARRPAGVLGATRDVAARERSHPGLPEPDGSSPSWPAPGEP